MLATSNPDRIDIAFDDDRLGDHAGLLLPATLAGRLGLRELADAHLDLGDAPGRANAGDKLVTLVASALAGGDCIADADAMRAGGAGRVLGCTVKAPSTLGTFLRSFRWGHVRQLDRLSRELLARSWAAGAGPGEAPLTIDLDSTLCETYGLAKEGARHPGYSGARGYHPLLAVAAGTGEVLMARLREGRANTARGAAHFLRETVARVRAAGASGQLTMRADSGFYNHAVVAAWRALDVRFSVTIRQQPNVGTLIEAIPEADWTPIPYWLPGGAAVAETTYTPFQHTGDASAVRLIVRRVKPTPGSQLALFVDYSYHAFITDRAGEMMELEADHRRHAAELSGSPASRPVKLRSVDSGLRNLVQLPGGAVVDEPAHVVLVWDEGACLDARHRLPHVLVEVAERFQRERRTDAGIGHDRVLHGIVAEGQHAAVRVVDEDDGGRAQQPLRDRQRADRIVRHDATRVADHVRVAFPDSQQLVGVETCVHAGHYGQPQARGQWQVALVETSCVASVVFKQVVGNGHWRLLALWLGPGQPVWGGTTRTVMISVS